MEGLPFEVVYGAWIWRGALLIFLGGAIALAWARFRWRARAAWRETRQSAGRPASPGDGSDGETITIAGRLEAEGAATRFEDGAEAAAASAGPPEQALVSSRADKLELVTGDGRVELDGDVEVLAGSEESWPGKPSRKLPKAVKERLGKAFLRDAELVCRSVRSGERALATGVLRSVAATEGTGYREPGRRFVLEEATLIAGAPPRVRGPARTRLLRAATVGGVLFLAVFGLGGAMLGGVSKKEHVSELRPLPELLRGYGATRLLAATPFHRDDALGRLEGALSSRGAPSREVRDALVALSDVRGDCTGAMRVLEQHREFRRVLERGERCTEPEADRLAAGAAFALGELEEASRLLRGPLKDAGSPDDHAFAIRVHLLAGDLAEAAAAADRAAAWLRSPWESWLNTDSEAVAHRADLARRFECVGAALRAREGDGEARGRLERLLEETGAIECRLLLADLASGSARDELLDGAEEVPWRVQEVPGLLRAESAPLETALDAELPSVDLGSHLQGSGLAHRRAFGLGLEAALFEALADRDDLPTAARLLRRRLAERAIAAASLLGRYDEARELLDSYGVAWDEDSSGPDRTAFRAFIELRAGDLEAAREALEAADGPGDYARRRVEKLVEALEQNEVQERFGAGLISAEVLSRALRGEGGRLAEAVRENHYHSTLLRRLAALGPWLPEEVLADCLQFCRPMGSELRYALPSALGYLTVLARLASSAGDAERARELERGARRIREAMTRREIAVPLAVLESF